MNQYVMYILLNIVNSATYDHATRAIAKDILLNLNIIPSLSLEGCANFLHISISTLNRFCKKIGFYNYSSFRNDCSKIDYELEKVNFYPIEEIPVDYDILHDCLCKIESLSLNSLIDRMFRAKTIYFLGMDFQFQCLHFQQGMMLRHKYVEICLPLDALPKMKEDDLLIVLSMNGIVLSSCIQDIKKARAKKVWITQKEKCEYDSIFNEIIRLPFVNMKSIHKYELAYLFDLILSKYYKNCSNYEQLK